MRTRVTARNELTGERKTINDTVKQLCMSADFIAKNAYLTPSIDIEKMQQQQAQCSVADQTQTDRSASWTMTCTTAQGQVIDARIRNRVGATRLSSNIEQRIVDGDKRAIVNVAVTGKFTGKCTPDMPAM